MTSITIPNSVTSIGVGAFSYCTGLTIVEISDITAWCNISFGNSSSNPLSYANHLYLNGNEVTNLVIPNSVTSIGDDAFRNCSGLTSVTIPNSVTHIGKMAFSNCSGLTKIVVLEGNSTFDSRNDCNAIIETSTNTLVVGCKNTTILNSVTSIGNYAFYWCTGLTSVTIPNSVTSIGNYAFSDCSGLTSVTIPNSVTSIGVEAFYNCKGLTSVTIPNSVTSIGDKAFYGCSNLIKSAYPDNLSDPFNKRTAIAYPSDGIIDENGFIYDKNKNTIYFAPLNISSVTIPNSVTSIGDYAFYYCKGLTSIQCDAATPPTLSTSVFDGVDKQNCSLIVPDGSLEAYKAADQWKDFLNIGGVEEIAIEESNISIENGKIINSNNENIEVYNLSGVKVYSGNKAEVELNSGVYIVVIGNKALKIAL